MGMLSASKDQPPIGFLIRLLCFRAFRHSEGHITLFGEYERTHSIFLEIEFFTNTTGDKVYPCFTRGILERIGWRGLEFRAPEYLKFCRKK
ncbi:hypothetical protein AKJ41_05670 [candidate division MSBL1 archaeon SCGC-AAA259O05]|uniref:Uncharacterized protein n=1 Tax=candidate division MSBL1 archaeon SCGC-AAA259O05 TaxID=1698271 RepID=A0A133UYL9_9EURY|nr:hypothetical protein AKJ41_05670 [candidate division MSBL1 archaeon SCGC-AAA259O05]